LVVGVKFFYFFIKERRVSALNEILRVLKVGGEALVYCWARSQQRDDNLSSWANKKVAKETGSTYKIETAPASPFSFLPIYNEEVDFSQTDVLVPWTKADSKDVSKHHRYYHVFNEGELESLLKLVKPSPEVVNSYYEQGNWVIHFKKSYRSVLSIT